MESNHRPSGHEPDALTICATSLSIWVLEAQKRYVYPQAKSVENSISS